MFVLTVYVKSNNIRYLGKHAGDLYIRGYIDNIISQKYNISDYYLEPTNLTITHDNEKWTFKQTVTGYCYAIIHHFDDISPNGIVIEFDSYAPNITSNSESIGLHLAGDSSSIFIAHNKDGSRNQLMWSGGYADISFELKQKWLHNKYTFQNGTMTYELIYEGTVRASKSLSIPSAILNSTHFIYRFINPWNINGSRDVKNLKLTFL